MRELGWRATSLGTKLPAATFAEAVRDNRPRLLWISVSCIESIPVFLNEYGHLQTWPRKPARRSSWVVGPHRQRSDSR